jgi:GT2 family glycosyltransferase
MTRPELSILIVSYNVRQMLLDCLRAIRENVTGVGYEVIVVDNASTDGSADALRKADPDVILLANRENAGFAKANNAGYAVSRGDFVLLLNPDTVVKPGAIERVLAFMKTRPDAGIGACRLVRANGEVQKSIRYYPRIAHHALQAVFIDRAVYPSNFTATYYRRNPFVIDYPSGAFMMVRRSALGGMPLLCEDYFMYSEEKDLALRLKDRKYRTYFVPDAETVHFGEQSTSQMAEQMFLELQRSQVLFFRKHYSGLYGWGLAISWWLVLFTNYLLSLPLLIGGNKQRHRLFGEANRAYYTYLQYMMR